MPCPAHAARMILVPSIRMSPSIGRYSPMMFFIRLDLPEPEPPRITMISPRFTSNDAFSKRTRVP